MTRGSGGPDQAPGRRRRRDHRAASAPQSTAAVPPVFALWRRIHRDSSPPSHLRQNCPAARSRANQDSAVAHAVLDNRASRSVGDANRLGCMNIPGSARQTASILSAELRVSCLLLSGTSGFQADSAGGLGKPRVDTPCTMRRGRDMRAERNDRTTAISKVTRLLACSLAALAVATSVGTAARSQAPALVRVDSGELQGVVDDGVVSFKGIPFAAPPVGDLRWRPPQPAAPWTGVRQAAEFGANCMQGRFGPPPAAGAPAPRLRRRIACS